MKVNEKLPILFSSAVSGKILRPALFQFTSESLLMSILRVYRFPQY